MLSTGGMATKLTAARLCMEAGTDMLIVNGARADIIYDVLEGKSVGTRFIGRNT
jgi:glutamate 5-kinase